LSQAPNYTSDPLSKKAPNDDHPPTGISAGQDFLADIYNTLISNTEFQNDDDRHI
jgi:hypothetical protein